MFLFASLTAPLHAHVQMSKSELSSAELNNGGSTSVPEIGQKSDSSKSQHSHNGNHKNCEECGNCHHSFVGLLVQSVDMNVLPSALPAPSIEAAVPHPHIDAFVRPPRV